MTNRDWLNTLTDDELAEWFCDALIDKDLSKRCGETIRSGLHSIMLSYNDSLGGMKQWLKEKSEFQL